MTLAVITGAILGIGRAPAIELAARLQGVRRSTPTWPTRR
jgi:short-subunit dehydrogenase